MVVTILSTVISAHSFQHKLIWPQCKLHSLTFWLPNLKLLPLFQNALMMIKVLLDCPEKNTNIMITTFETHARTLARTL